MIVQFSTPNERTNEPLQGKNKKKLHKLKQREIERERDANLVQPRIAYRTSHILVVHTLLHHIAVAWYWQPAVSLSVVSLTERFDIPLGRPPTRLIH